MRDIERKPFQKLKRLRRWRFRGPDGASQRMLGRAAPSVSYSRRIWGIGDRIQAERDARTRARALSLLPLAQALHYLPAGSISRVQAMIWYVNSKLNSGSSDGRTAFASLQQALDHAKAGDTILIAPGAYDHDLAARVSTARAANIIVGVVGA